MATFEQIWVATYDWLQVAQRQGFTVDWDADPVSSEEWDDACAASEVLAPDDSEGGFAVVKEPRSCDTLLRAGDIVATSGPGGDVAFLRRVARESENHCPACGGDPMLCECQTAASVDVPQYGE